MEAIKRKKIREKTIENIFLICACVAVISLLAITFFVFYNGLAPFVSNSYSLWSFLTGVEWRPGSNLYGIFYMIVGSVLATFGAILIGVPVAILTAVFIAEMAGSQAGKVIRFAVELLYSTGVVLFVFIMIINLIVNRIVKAKVGR